MNGKQKGYISTHTPHAGRDEFRTLVESLDENFYSHAPCGARPAQAEKELAAKQNFYSHAPCGARLETLFSNRLDFTFLLTRPMRGATILSNCGVGILTISTHTPHAGRDPCPGIACTVSTYFYSHAPCGARRDFRFNIRPSRKFLLTRPMRGATTVQDMVSIL